MSYRSIIDDDAAILSPTFELDSCKGRAEIYNDPIGHTKPVHNVLHELDCLCDVELDEWIVFYLLSELVNSHVDVLKATRCSFERSNHVEPQHEKGHD